MALWAGTAINSTETAMVFNRLYQRKALAIVRRKNGLLYKMLGKPDIGSVRQGRTTFERSQRIAFKNVEVQLLGALPSTEKLADGSAELATVTPSFNANAFGGAEFPLTHYTQTEGIPSSQLKRYKGPDAKTDSFYDQSLTRIMLGYENDWGTDLHNTDGTTTVGRTVLGSVWFAISTGGGDSGADATAETGNAFRYYGTIDRQDSANADYRGVVNAAWGPSTLGKIRSMINQVDANGGVTDTIVMGTSLYTTHQLLLEPYTYITNAADMVDFGGRYMRYDGADFIHDQRTPSGTVGGLDSKSWFVVQNDDDLTEEGIVKDHSRKAGYVIQTECWMQVICLQPNMNWKALGAS